MRDRNAADARPSLERRRFLAAVGATGATLSAGCVGLGDQTGGGGATASDGQTTGTGGDDAADWRSVELRRVRGEETFTIGDLDGPVVVESFAVWCPTCERQANELAGAEAPTRIGLNTDPNEDADRVREYAANHDFGWRFAVAPASLTAALIDEFGSVVANAPSTPLLFVCDDGTAELVAGEVLGTDEILAAAEDC